jgi:hypothetical protein
MSSPNGGVPEAADFHPLSFRNTPIAPETITSEPSSFRATFRGTPVRNTSPAPRQVCSTLTLVMPAVPLISQP